MKEFIDKAKMWIANNKPLAIALGVAGAGALFYKLKKKSDLRKKRQRAARKARLAKKRKRSRR